MTADGSPADRGAVSAGPEAEFYRLAAEGACERIEKIAALLKPATLNGEPMWGSLSWTQIAQAYALATEEVDRDALRSDYQSMRADALAALAGGETQAEPDESDPLAGLPADLAAILRDQSIIVPQDAGVFELIAKWANAPSNTANGESAGEPK